MAEPPRFDWTFRVEHLISIAGVAVTIIAGWYLMDYRLGKLETNVDRHMTQLTAAVIEIVRIETRVSEHERRLGYLERR